MKEGRKERRKRYEGGVSQPGFEPGGIYDFARMWAVFDYSTDFLPTAIFWFWADRAIDTKQTPKNAAVRVMLRN